jgi:SIT4-associating protein SAP185/190
MLKGGNPLTVGVGIVIEVIRKNNSDYDPDVGAEPNAPPTNRDPIYLGTLLRMFAKHVPDFMELILSPNHTIGGGDGPVTVKRKELNAAFGGKIEPLGFDRFKTCELMAELLHCSNMGLLNEVGGEEFVKARDAERERLKAEGKLTATNDYLSGMGEDLTLKSSTQLHSEAGSPEGRRLEIANASDDDGFEEVTHAATEDGKDDFDEKADNDDGLITPLKSDASLSFLDKDDAEFVDEPLSSPRLNAEPEESKFEHAETTDDVTDQHASAAVEEKGAADKVEGASDEPASEHSVEAVEPKNAQEADIGAQLDGITNLTLTESQEHDFSLHPEAKVAPLSIKKADPAQFDDTTIITRENADDTIDEDNTQSVIVTHEESHIAQEGQVESPVVGDYLKMQFVEHKVVPTILVSWRLILVSGSNVRLGFLL